MSAVSTTIFLWKKVSELWKENSSQNQLVQVHRCYVGIFAENSHEFHQFVEYINSEHDSIKFTEEFSSIEIAFLNVTTGVTIKYTVDYTANQLIAIAT